MDAADCRPGRTCPGGLAYLAGKLVKRRPPYAGTARKIRTSLSGQKPDNAARLTGAEEAHVTISAFKLPSAIAQDQPRHLLEHLPFTGLFLHCWGLVHDAAKRLYSRLRPAFPRMAEKGGANSQETATANSAGHVQDPHADRKFDSFASKQLIEVLAARTKDQNVTPWHLYLARIAQPLNLAQLVSVRRNAVRSPGQIIVRQSAGVSVAAAPARTTRGGKGHGAASSWTVLKLSE